MACKVLVVCGSPVVASADLLRRLAKECDYVVAVDRGLDALLSAGLGCDVYVGDADTVSDAGRALVDAATDFEVERHDPYKDYTDLALALDSVRRRWPGAEVVATCVTGGRPDMALSVLGLLQKRQEPLARRHLGVAIDQDVAKLAIQLLAIRANAPRVVVGLALVLERQMLKLGKIVDRHVDTVAVQ